MPRKKAKHIKVELRRQKVTQLLLDGKTYAEITTLLKKEFRISPSTISRDVAYIQDQWRESMASTYEQRVAAELARLIEIDQEAKQEWELYKAGKRFTTKRERIGGKGKGSPPRMVTTETKSYLPDRGFLETRRAISGDIRQLMGLNKPTKVEMSGEMVASNPLVDKLAAELDETAIRGLLTAVKKTLGKST